MMFILVGAGESAGKYEDKYEDYMSAVEKRISTVKWQSAMIVQLQRYYFLHTSRGVVVFRMQDNFSYDLDLKKINLSNLAILDVIIIVCIVNSGSK